MSQKRSEVKKEKGNKRKASRKTSIDGLPPIRMNAAGIDIGATEHWVAVPADGDEKTVRRFGTFTADLHEIADWLRRCGIDTVAMESTGVYWIPLFQILEAAGFEVFLVNARQLKNVSGRKNDLTDCQWIQQLHTFGLLSGSFRPDDQSCVVRSYMRHRDNLIKQASMHILHMQKALDQMNVQLHHVISDITGKTGLAILDSILRGERDGVTLARLRDPHIQSSEQTIVKALQGDYRQEHLFVLQQALEAFRFCQAQMGQCDRELEDCLNHFESKIDLEQTPAPKPKRTKRSGDNQPAFNLHTHLYRITGVDVTTINGLNAYSGQVILSETGLDMTRWRTEKHFASWLGLCPEHRISGGKILKRNTRHVINRAACMFRIAASTLERSKSALGAFFRRLKARLGAASAIEAIAHKIARLFYRLMRCGHNYVDPGEKYYEEKYRERLIKNLTKRAKTFGYQLVQVQPVATGVS